MAETLCEDVCVYRHFMWMSDWEEGFVTQQRGARLARTEVKIETSHYIREYRI